MKRTRTIIIIALVATVAGITLMSSCRKNAAITNSVAPEFPASVTSVIPQNLIDTMRKKGMNVYSGDAAPNIEGVYYHSPNTLVSPYGPDDTWWVGKVIDDYKYQFYDQVNNNLRINYKSLPYKSDTGAGLGCIITGRNNNFTVFFQFTGVADGVPYTMVGLISGTISSSGIKSFQLGFMMTGKTGDDGNVILQPVNTGRVYKDGDGLAEKISTFRVKPTDNDKTSQGGMCAH